MDDLKLKIGEIERMISNNQNINRFYEITKLALERNELYKLLSADDSYVYNNNGEMWLAGNNKWYGMQSPGTILEHAIISALEKIYVETKSSEIESELISAIKKMLYGTPQQFFLAIRCFSCISRDIQAYRKKYSYSHFDYFGRNKDIPLDAELRPFIKKAIEERRDFIKDNFAYDCNLWQECEYQSRKLVEQGLIGFMPEIR